ncbi:GNAT family N-acetyltransferase [Streptomyces sp. NPDC091272]|uniref:GNAT family N-acetyltransferase n=1 Tax=Streptomyces sp. NPDC091272 TaxID=3365981 RepID=UPI0037F2BA07
MSQITAEVQVRPGVEADLRELTDLYNHFISETPITFDTAPFTLDERRPWLLSHPEDGPHRLVVARDARTDRLLGYATSSPFRPKAAFGTSVETTVYCAPDAGGRGVGTLLYDALFEALAKEDVHRAYAGVTHPNEASARLHARFGFTQVGLFREVGRKFGQYWDVAWYEKDLTAPGSEPQPQPQP